MRQLATIAHRALLPWNGGASFEVGDVVRLEDAANSTYGVVLDKGPYSVGLMLAPDGKPLQVVNAPRRRIHAVQPMEAPTGRLIAVATAIKDDHGHYQHF